MYRGNEAGAVAVAPPCDACGRPKPPKVAVCPHCGGLGDRHIELSEKVAAKMKASHVAPWPGWLRALLFVAALPVLVPSLIVHRLFVRRRAFARSARVSYLTVLVDGAIVVASALGHPVLVAVACGALAGTLVLVFHAAARGRLHDGAFLGFSRATELFVSFGGAALAIGLFFAVTPGEPFGWKWLPALAFGAFLLLLAAWRSIEESA